MSKQHSLSISRILNPEYSHCVSSPSATMILTMQMWRLIPNLRGQLYVCPWIYWAEYEQPQGMKHGGWAFHYKRMIGSLQSITHIYDWLVLGAYDRVSWQTYIVAMVYISCVVGLYRMIYGLKWLLFIRSRGYFDIYY